MSNNQQSTELQMLKVQRQEMIDAKNKVSAELSELKGRMKLPAQQHVRNMELKRQAGLVAAGAELDGRFVAINKRIKALNVILSNGIKPAELVDNQESSVSPIRDLAHLRDEYQKFSADKTRVSSMRAMAAQFALELTPIIRTLISGKQPTA